MYLVNRNLQSEHGSTVVFRANGMASCPRVIPLLLSQQVEIVQLIPILENVPLDLRRINPRDKVLHVPRD